MSFSLTDVLTGLKLKIRQREERQFPVEEQLNAIRDALQHYSGDSFRLFVEDLPGGAGPFDLPATFIVGWSTIRAIESPIDSSPPIYLVENDDWVLVDLPTGTKIKFISFVPGDPFRITFNRLHELKDLKPNDDELKATATTINVAHQRAFISLCAYYAAISIMTAKAGEGSDRIRGNTINFRGKSNEWKTAAEKYLEAYNIVVKENDEAASELMDVDIPTLPFGIPRLWHFGRRT